jgi:hypothetical protein
VTDTVASEEESRETREVREVSEGREVIVGEVDRILILQEVNTEPKKDIGQTPWSWASSNQYSTAIHQFISSLHPSGTALTLAIPKFSIAGILCPARAKRRYQSSSQIKG